MLALAPSQVVNSRCVLGQSEPFLNLWNRYISSYLNGLQWGLNRAVLLFFPGNLQGYLVFMPLPPPRIPPAQKLRERKAWSAQLLSCPWEQLRGRIRGQMVLSSKHFLGLWRHVKRERGQSGSSSALHNKVRCHLYFGWDGIKDFCATFSKDWCFLHLGRRERDGESKEGRERDRDRLVTCIAVQELEVCVHGTLVRGSGLLD
jgi:hypothetical protein